METLWNWLDKNLIGIVRIGIGVIVGVTICYQMITVRLDQLEKNMEDIKALKIEVQLAEIQTDLKYIKQQLEKLDNRR